MLRHIYLELLRSQPYLAYWNRVVFAIVFLLDVFLVYAGSSGAVPFGELHTSS